MSRWQGKTVLVTGGSRGLGRAIAGAFASRGARVVIAARDADALEQAAGELSGEDREVLPISSDVTDQTQVESLIEQTVARFGRLDVLINNAGRSDRRDILDATAEDFQNVMEINLFAVVRLTRAAAPHLIKNRGHVVNIGSLASKSAARWLGTYPASKFALAAYSQQLRLELGQSGLHVLLVCPGPISGESSAAAPVAPAAGGLPERASRPGGGVRTRALIPEVVAERIIRACERRQPELVLPRRARLLFALAQISPRLGDWLVRRMT